MMQGEKIAERSARGAGGGRAATHSPVPALSAAVRRLERRAAQAPALVEPAVKAIDARSTRWRRPTSISSGAARRDFDPRELERIEERLFALRAASRKYNRRRSMARGAGREIRRRRALIDAGAEQLKRWKRRRRGRQALRARGQTLAARKKAAKSSTRRSMPNWRR
jgi:DNA repair protein RecN (Recombination protein N)